TMSAADRAARHESIEKLYAITKSTDKDRTTIESIQTDLTNARKQWKRETAKKNATKIPEDTIKAADELQKKAEAVAEKYMRPRQALDNADPPFEWKPDPLPNQVQNLLNDLDGFSTTPDSQQQEKLAELTKLVPEASAKVKNVSNDL